jgi:hypothetical protein
VARHGTRLTFASLKAGPCSDDRAPHALAPIDRHVTARKPSALPDPQLIKQLGVGASVSHLETCEHCSENQCRGDAEA